MKDESAGSLLAYTPMFHARLFNETQKFRDRNFQAAKSGLKEPFADLDEAAKEVHLDGNPSIDRPLFVQFCANDPDELLQAARYVQPYCDAIDLNLGCPQGIARKGNYGAFLQEDQDLIYKLINKLHIHLSIPVTAKVRVLETNEKTLQYARNVLAAGASILTVHGRQRHQKGHMTGVADWSTIKYLRNNLPPETVIFANGNILRHDDIEKCLEATGADGVMSAEGNLHDPTIFAPPSAIGAEGREYWRGRDGKGGCRIDFVFRRYLNILYQHVLEKPPPPRSALFLPSDPPLKIDESSAGAEQQPDEPPKKKQKRGNNERPTSPSLQAMQPHLFRLLRHLVSRHTNIRDALARARAGDMSAYENVLAMVESVVRDGLIEYETDPSKFDEQIEEAKVKGVSAAVEEEISDESSLATVRECRRPWWVCQPWVRPLPKEAMEKGSITLGKKDKKKLLEENVEGDLKGKTGVLRSEREVMDEKDGIPIKEMPSEAMVAG